MDCPFPPFTVIIFLLIIKEMLNLVKWLFVFSNGKYSITEHGSF